MPIIKNKINKGLANVLSETALRKEVAKLSKRANTRLRAIEKANLTEASETYRKLQADEYSGASYIKQTKHGEMKFDTALKEKTLASLREEFEEIVDFLNAYGSSVKGIKERWKTPYEIHMKFREKEGRKPMSYAKFSRYFSDIAYEKLRSMFGSDQAMIIVEDLLETSEGNWEIVEEMVNRLEEIQSKTGEVSFKTAERIKMGLIKEYHEKIKEDAKINTYSSEDLSPEDIKLLDGI